MLKIEKQIDFSAIPTKTGFGANSNKMVIDWNKSVGCKIPFIYDNIKGELDVISYNSKTKKITIQFNELIYDIKAEHLKRVQIGRMLEIKQKPKDISKFKYRDGDVIKLTNGECTILNSEIITRYKKDGSKCNDKYYKYKCNKCSYIGKAIEHNLVKMSACPCCSNQIVVQGVNDIPTTEPWMIKYFQGGYDEAKLYTRGSNKRIHPICPECKRTKSKSMIINSIFKQGSIGCICGDGFSYSEKFIDCILSQLNLKHSWQITKRDFDWCGDKRYDFYFEYNDEKYIIEAHGIQHYKYTGFTLSLEDQIKNDEVKKDLALKNGIRPVNYIVLDCREAEVEWIKKSILSSKLNEIFDLSKIDWIKCGEYALSNLVKKVCDIWNKHGDKYSTTQIGEIFNISRDTVVAYLKKGVEVGWCDYANNYKKHK